MDMDMMYSWPSCASASWPCWPSSDCGWKKESKRKGEVETTPSWRTTSTNLDHTAASNHLRFLLYHHFSSPLFVSFFQSLLPLSPFQILFHLLIYFFIYCRSKVTRIHTNPPISSPSYYFCGPHPWCRWYDFWSFFLCFSFLFSFFFLFFSLFITYSFLCWNKTDDLQIYRVIRGH